MPSSKHCESWIDIARQEPVESPVSRFSYLRQAPDIFPPPLCVYCPPFSPHGFCPGRLTSVGSAKRKPGVQLERITALLRAVFWHDIHKWSGTSSLPALTHADLGSSPHPFSWPQHPPCPSWCVHGALVLLMPLWIVTCYIRLDYPN